MSGSNDLTTPEGVLALMESSKNQDEWNANCDAVKAANDGYPAFWFETIIQPGVANRVLGGGAGDIKVTTF